MSNTEVELLRECCRLLDECEVLRERIAIDGMTVLGSAKQPRIHPAVAELRQSRLALGRLLGQLDLPDENGDALPTPTQARARTAAQARWRNERRAVGG